MRSPKTKTLVLSALFTAIIFVFTAYILHIPFLNGYIHFGDAFIFLAASLLPLPYSAFAAAIGAGLADLLTFPLWTGPTLLIKALIALCFSARTERIICKRNLVGLAAALCINLVGYYIATGLLFEDWLIPVIRLGTDLAPPLISACLYVTLGHLLDRLSIRTLFQ